MPLSRFRPECYQALLHEKVAATTEMMHKFLPPAPKVYSSAPEGYRLRAEFSMWHQGESVDYVMFRPDQPRTPVTIKSFPIADKRIQQAMPVLHQSLNGSSALRRKLFQVEFLATLAGDLLVTLVYHRQLDKVWESAAQTLLVDLRTHTDSISIIGRSRKQKLVLGREFVQEVLSVHGNTYRYRQYEQSFSQPNGRINICMIEWACEHSSAQQGDLLELYCGNGNFTLPLSQHFDHVIATEVSKTSINAARANLQENNIENVQLIRLSAEEVTQAMSAQREFRRLRDLPKPLDQYELKTLFVDPPRAGLDEHTLRMASHFETIIYVSCNPHTLAQNLLSLHETHRIEHFALFDQFPYTDHIECGVLLQRR